MSLEGSIKTIGLPDVLTLLASTSKSGELQVRTERGEGLLWIDGGRLSDHDVAHCPDAVDALFELLRAEGGTFTFSDRAERTGSDLREIGPLLSSAQERLQEWNGIAAVVPSVSHRVRLVADPEVDRVELDKDAWALVLAVGEGNRVRVILDRRQLGEFDGCRAIKALVEMGLAVVDDAAGTLPALTTPSGTSELPRSPEPAAWTFSTPTEEPSGRALLGPQADDLLRAAVADAGGWRGSPSDSVEDQEAERTSIPTEGADDADDDAASTSDSHEAFPGDAQAALRAMLAQVVDAPGEPAMDLPAGGPADVAKEHSEAMSEGEETPEAELQPAGEVPADQPEAEVDAVAAHAGSEALDDRGPWSRNELDGLDRSEWWPGEPAAGDPAASDTETEATPPEEPMNRGLLLKFLSSVRN